MKGDSGVKGEPVSKHTVMPLNIFYEGCALAECPCLPPSLNASRTG